MTPRVEIKGRGGHEAPPGLGPFVLGIERVNNAHILPIFDQLYRHPGIRFEGCVLQRQPPWRVQLGWPELPPESRYLKYWESPATQAQYVQWVREADVVIWPGLKHPRGVRLLRSRNRLGRPNVIWAERFIHRRRRSTLETLGMKLTVRLLNTPNMHLMSLGPGADVDYRLFGASRWRCWSMGYAVTPLGVLNHDLAPAPEGIFRLLFVGELCRRKGADLLLAALGRPELAGLKWRLCIVGDGAERAALESAARSLGLATQMDFVGAVPRERLDAYYAASDVLVLPSRFDGWGAVINEAMEHGLAVVASDQVGAAASLVEPGMNGWVFGSENVAALAAALGRIMAEPEVCARMRQASRDRIDLFRPARVADRVAAFCRGLAGNGPMPEYREGWCRPL